SGRVRAEMDATGLDELFTFWAPVAPRTMFSGIHQVRPGELVEFSGGRLRHRQYWHWPFPPECELRSGQPKELADELESILQDATRIRLRADVPVGAYLSGGLD